MLRKINAKENQHLYVVHSSCSKLTRTGQEECISGEHTEQKIHQSENLNSLFYSAI